MTTTYWIEKSKENIDAAELLSNEGFYAIANTRAYYAMFYAAQALLETLNLSFSKHSAVITAFGKEFIKNGKLDPKYHQYLIGAQASRQTGDYQTGVYMTQDEAELVISWAKEFYAEACLYLSENK
jgi:uncharacterized protein (UPF0332 family)